MEVRPGASSQSDEESLKKAENINRMDGLRQGTLARDGLLSLRLLEIIMSDDEASEFAGWCDR
jgi:hypothetical protein